MFIIIGVIILAIGVFMVIKSEAMLNAFGRIEFFERHLSSDGGSRLGYKIIGLMAIFIGFLIMTNLIAGFMTWLLAPLLKYGRPQ